jgi:integrase
MTFSNTLFEEFKMEKGRILNDTLADYKLAEKVLKKRVTPHVLRHSSATYWAPEMRPGRPGRWQTY